MAEEQDAIVNALLPDMIGRTAKFEKYDRTADTPLNFLLNQVQPELPKPFSVYWVNGGLPELFCLPGLASTPIVYNSRYIEMVYLMRRLMGDGPLSNFRAEMVERSCLRIMAELALRYKGPAWAVRAFIKSILGEGVRTLDIPGSAIMDLEVQPINPGYMGVWFFGLAHELGHVYGERKEPYNELISPEAALEAAKCEVEKFPLPPGGKEEALAQVASGREDHPLSPRQLAREALADGFAVHALFKTTRLIMAEVGKEKFDVVEFTAEITVAWALISILERCKLMASVAEQGVVEARQKEALLLQPISYSVRALLARRVLEFEIVEYLRGAGAPTNEKWRKVDSAVNRIARIWEDAMKQVESGLARAMRFALFPKERPSNLMTLLAGEITRDRVGSQKPEIIRFCDLAESFHPGNETVQALRRIARAGRGQE